MTTPIMRDDPVAVLGEKQHLCIPRVRIQRPAMRKRDRLSLTPVFVINRCTVSGGKRVCGQRSASKRSHEGVSLRPDIPALVDSSRGAANRKAQLGSGTHTPKE